MRRGVAGVRPAERTTGGGGPRGAGTAGGGRLVDQARGGRGVVAAGTPDPAAGAAAKVVMGVDSST
jgi:hypothetical protein